VIVAIGSDHAGYELKEWLKPRLAALGHDPLDVGAFDASPSDYPDCARAVAETLLAGRVERGLLICGSGVGVSVAASKVPGIRAAVCHDTYSAHQGVEHDDMNVLVLGARIIGVELALELVRTFLEARFSGAERHVRRLGKVAAIERDARAGAFDAPAIGR
jgi:ribose 5-phosphate isomerase B